MCISDSVANRRTQHQQRRARCKWKKLQQAWTKVEAQFWMNHWFNWKLKLPGQRKFLAISSDHKASSASRGNQPTAYGIYYNHYWLQRHVFLQETHCLETKRVSILMGFISSPNRSTVSPAKSQNLSVIPLIRRLLWIR